MHGDGQLLKKILVNKIDKKKTPRTKQNPIDWFNNQQFINDRPTCDFTHSVWERQMKRDFDGSASLES